MIGCRKCCAVTGIVFLILGILFLLQDLNVWAFFDINWWSALLIYFGIASLAMRSCAECMAVKGKK